MPDVRISLLNADESETSVGEVHGASSRASVGEIVLRSPYLSPGYWSEFAANEFPMSVTNAGVEREYKTGDLGVIRPEQGLVHVGREDSQVKLAGFRVEIAEVEACLLAYPGVREAAVLGHTPEHGERELLGFVEMDSGDVHCGSFVRSFVNSRLPGHMVPSEIVAVARMPCTPNGKVDRAALLRMRAAVRNAKGRRAPSTPTECSLCEIWMESLHLEQVGVDDNFFELGGNSLLGMKLTAQVATRFSVRPPALMIFNYSTIQQMAQLVERLLSDAVPASSQLDFEEGII
jgi:acyl carrier protein